MSKAIKEEFGYLTKELGFKVLYEEKEKWWFAIAYVSQSVGVRVHFEIRDQYINVYLHKLVDGKMTKPPLFIRAGMPLNAICLDDILSLRAPAEIPKPPYEYGEKSEFFDPKNGASLYVRRIAKNLNKYAKDVLGGDFSVFSMVEPMVWKRAEELGGH